MPSNLPRQILRLPVRISRRLFRESERVFRQFWRIAALLPKFTFLTPSEQEILVNILAHSEGGAAPELKLKLYQTLKRLKNRRRKPFGMLIILGWKGEWRLKYALIPDSSQNLFDGRSFDFAAASQDRALERLSELADFDGAIFMNEKGEIVASGMYLDNMNPKRVAELLRPGRAEDLSEAFGFTKKVHTRHLAGIAASYWLKGTTVFVVSEEDGSIRIFERGRIIFSTIRSEMYHGE